MSTEWVIIFICKKFHFSETLQRGIIEEENKQRRHRQDSQVMPLGKKWPIITTVGPDLIVTQLADNLLPVREMGTDLFTVR